MSRLFSGKYSVYCYNYIIKPLVFLFLPVVFPRPHFFLLLIFSDDDVLHNWAHLLLYPIHLSTCVYLISYLLVPSYFLQIISPISVYYISPQNRNIFTRRQLHFVMDALFFPFPQICQIFTHTIFWWQVGSPYQHGKEIS